MSLAALLLASAATVAADAAVARLNIGDCTLVSVAGSGDLEITCGEHTRLLSKLAEVAELPSPSPPMDPAIIMQASCAAVLEADPTATSGQYMLSAGGIEFETTCEMDTLGGGWTLISNRDDDAVDVVTTDDTLVAGSTDYGGKMLPAVAVEALVPLSTEWLALPYGGPPDGATSVGDHDCWYSSDASLTDLNCATFFKSDGSYAEGSAAASLNHFSLGWYENSAESQGAATGCTVSGGDYSTFLGYEGANRNWISNWGSVKLAQRCAIGTSDLDGYSGWAQAKYTSVYVK